MTTITLIDIEKAFMSEARELLNSYGITFDQARDFIYANLSRPELIYNTAASYGVTFEMLAELYGQGVSSQDVKSFFSSQGFSTYGQQPFMLDGSAEPLGQTKSRLLDGLSATATPNTEYVSALLSDEYWSAVNDKVTYSSPTTMPSSHRFITDTANGWRPLNTIEELALERAAISQNQFINVDLEPLISTFGSVADIQVAAVDQGFNTEAFAFFPGFGIGGDIFLNNNPQPDISSYYSAGGFGAYTLAHELGHAMGLDHTFEGMDTLPSSLDNIFYSIMSYTFLGNFEVEVEVSGNSYSVYTEDAYRADLGIFDVAALQAIYGADEHSNTEDNIYIYNEAERQFEGAQGHYMTIWDAGGNDTIDASNATYSSIVNLSDYSLSSISQRTAYDEAYELAGVVGRSSQAIDFIEDFISSLGEQAFLNTNNLGIAHGVVIENVITGNGNDVVYDNSVDNQIDTGVGDDTIILGAGGYDKVVAGEGYDRVVIEQLSSEVEIIQQDTSTYLLADDYAASLVGVEMIEFSNTTYSIA